MAGVPEPYYHDGQVTLWHGDALGRALAEIWCQADALVTDPPYGINSSRKRGTWTMPNGRLGRIHGDLDTTIRDQALTDWGFIHGWAWDRPAVVFGDLRLVPPDHTRKVLVYRKPPDAGTHGAVAGFRHDIEAVYLMGRPGLWPTGLGGRSSVLETGARSVGNPTGMAARYGHVHAKPVDVMEELVGGALEAVDHTTDGDVTVADPFAGAGSTIIAARNLGAKVLAVEIDLRNCERIVHRLKQGSLEFS